MTLTTFAAPLLKTDDILLCLHECGIQMTEAELNEPQRYKDQIKGVFLSLLVRLMVYSDVRFDTLIVGAEMFQIIG